MNPNNPLSEHIQYFVSLHFHLNVMNKLRQKKQQILRFLFGSFSATALMFTFQACYGMPSETYWYPMEGTVISESTQEPIPDIKVICERNGFMVNDAVSTDAEGRFIIDLNKDELDSVNIHLKDVDGEENGQYADLDTVLPVQAAIEHPSLFKMKEKSVE